MSKVKTARDFNEIEEEFLLEKLVLTTKASGLIDWLKRRAQVNSLWTFPFGTSCCALEFMSLSGGNLSSGELGADLTRHSPDRSDLLVVGGTITEKQAPILKSVYEKMEGPKWVIAMGACAASGGPYNTYSVLQGVSNIIPVDVYIPGCPPTAEAVIAGFQLMKERILKGAQRGVPPETAEKGL